VGSAKVRLALAAVLIGIFWPCNWLLPGLRTHLLFFPLWLGYALLADALTSLRSGTSLYERNPKAYAMLFAASAPAWWLFECLNSRIHNWEYVGRARFSYFEYLLLASLSFSTVIPAVFGTAELVRTARWIENARKGPFLRLSLQAFFAAGLLTLAAMLVWPRFFYPFAWLSLWLIFDPINAALGRRCLLADLRNGDWRQVLALSLGCLICGFFWEFWNFYSYPKWIYHIPFLDVLHVFEMPLAGYGGYLFFGPELYALYSLLSVMLPSGLRVRSTLDEPGRYTVLYGETAIDSVAGGARFRSSTEPESESDPGRN
jgi:hypothetical protein